MLRDFQKIRNQSLCSMTWSSSGNSLPSRSGVEIRTDKPNPLESRPSTETTFSFLKFSTFIQIIWECEKNIRAKKLFSNWDMRSRLAGWKFNLLPVKSVSGVALDGDGGGYELLNLVSGQAAGSVTLSQERRHFLARFAQFILILWNAFTEQQSTTRNRVQRVLELCDIVAVVDRGLVHGDGGWGRGGEDDCLGHEHGRGLAVTVARAGGHGGSIQQTTLVLPGLKLGKSHFWGKRSMHWEETLYRIAERVYYHFSIVKYFCLLWW